MRGEWKKRLNAELGTSQRCGMEKWLVWRRTQRGRKILILADSKAATAAVRKAGRTGKARSSHLKKVVDEIGARGPGMVKLGWVKSHMGILGNGAADVLAKDAAAGMPPDDHEKRMSGGGIRQWEKQRKRGYLEEGEEAVIGRAMRWRRKALTNYYRLRGGKGIGRWWDEKIGRVEDAGCPRCGEEEETLERKGKEGVGGGERDEVGQLGCVGIKEVGENGGFGPC